MEELGMHNRKQLKKDKVCGCYNCLTVFKPTEIEDWLDKNDTAVCPYCGVDSVISESCGYKPTKEVLKKLHLQEFGEN